MKKIVSERAGSILKEKAQLEKALKVKITSRGKEIYVEGAPFDEYGAEKVLDAINLGFPVENAIQIKTRELEFEKFNIKKYTNRTNLQSIRARLIGTKGKTLKTITQLTDCFLEMKDNDIGIIGFPEEIKKAEEAITSIIKGSKQSNVYKFLEKHQPKPVLDLGLKTKEVLEDKETGWEDDKE